MLLSNIRNDYNSPVVARTLLLSQILMEEEVITPPRGGGRPAPEPQGAPREVRAVPKSCHDMNPRLNDISCMETKEPANRGGTLNKLHESIRII